MRLSVVMAGGIALVATSCGQQSGTPGPYEQAQATTLATPSMHVTMHATVTTGLASTTITGSGDYSNREVLGAMTMTVASGTRGARMAVRERGTRFYLSSSLLDAQLPAGKRWLVLDVAAAAKALGTDLGSVVSQSPSSTLPNLAAVTGETVVGHERVGGVLTTHYSALVDQSRLPKEARGAVTFGPEEIWVDGSGLIRRVRLTGAVGAVGAPSSTEILDYRFSRFGEPVRVPLPAPAETVDLLGLVGGTLGIGG